MSVGGIRTVAPAAVAFAKTASTSGKYRNMLTGEPPYLWASMPTYRMGRDRAGLLCCAALRAACPPQVVRRMCSEGRRTASSLRLSLTLRSSLELAVVNR
jgi:hypothetical protein